MMDIQSLRSDDNWEQVFQFAKGFALEDVAEVCNAIVGEHDGDDWLIWGRLTNGRWFYLHAGCDYTGWDCRAWGDSVISNTREELIRMGMDTGARQRFGIPTPVVSDYRELLIGCGRDRKKRWCALPHHPREWRNVRVDGTKGPITLDVNPKVKPDLWCDLNGQPPWHTQVLEPVKDSGLDPDSRQELVTGVFYEMKSDYWDEIHAYQVLEHLGRQGDAQSFLRQFAELWRLLKPDGYLVAEVPSRFSGHLWGDPGHTRALVAESLIFLDRSQYVLQCDGPEARHSSMTDYRDIYSGDFRLIDSHDNRVSFVFVLQAVKPARGG